MSIADLATDPVLRPVPTVEGFKILGSCILFRRIGRGAAGSVYCGYDVEADRDVAVKCLRAGPGETSSDDVDRFRREADLARRLDHPNLVGMFDAGELEDVHYLVMELVRGETLRERVKRCGALSRGAALSVALGAARGLGAIHSESVVHRDVKPDNLLLTKAGIAKLGDLGVARDPLAHGPRTAHGVMLGTPQYMPPEQWEGAREVDATADVWALGAMFFFALAADDFVPARALGHAPKRSLEDLLDDMAERLPDPTDDVLEILHRCMSRDPSDRPANGAAVAEGLEPMAARCPVSDLADPRAGATTTRQAVIPVPGRATVERVREFVRKGCFDVRAKTATMWIPAFDTIEQPVVETGAPSVLDNLDPLPDAPTDETTGLPTAVADRRTGVRLVLVPAGTYHRGAPAEEDGAYPDERPAHEVTISKPFFLGRAPVTQGQWARVMSSKPSRFSGGADYPVDSVSFDEVARFLCESGFELPTEAEWEYACRAGTTTPFHFGATIRPSEANYDASFVYGDGEKGRGREGTVVVASHPANDRGLHDMHGNVWEWCVDWYSPKTYAELDAPVVDPEGPATGKLRVCRGGSWGIAPRSCRSAARIGRKPEQAYDNVGFRVVRRV